MPDTPESQVPREADAGADAHKARLAPGVLLLAQEALEDPNFNNAIVLLCQHGDAGAYGLVLNRPSHMPLREIFEHPPESESATRRVYIGGPVQPTELQILQVGDAVASDALEIVPGVHMGGKWETLEEILTPEPTRLRLFLGYAGWGGGQLEEEIEAGAWEVRQTDIRRLLDAPESSWASGSEQLRRFLGAS